MNWNKVLPEMGWVCYDYGVIKKQDERPHSETD